MRKTNSEFLDFQKTLFAIRNIVLRKDIRLSSVHEKTGFTVLIIIVILYVGAYLSTLGNISLKEVGANFKDPIQINFVRVINPRFSKLNEKQIEIFLNLLKKNTFRHLGISLNFKSHPSIAIEDFFEIAKVRLGEKKLKLDLFAKGNRLFPNQNPSILADALINEYKTGHEHFSLEKLIYFGKESLPNSKKEIFDGSNDLNEVMKKTASFHFDSFKKLKEIIHTDGNPIIKQDTNNHDYLNWNNSVTAFPEYDLDIPRI